jgi:hypothetical protein
VGKPFDEAIKLKGICRFCQPHTRSMNVSSPDRHEIEYLYNREFTCGQRDIGAHEDFCTRENYLQCPFKEVSLSAMPHKPPKPIGGHAIETAGEKENVSHPALKSPYRLPDITRKDYPKDADFFTALYILEFPDRGFFYAACSKYFKMTYSDVNPMIAGLDPNNKEQRINAWRQVVGHEMFKEG